MINIFILFKIAEGEGVGTYRVKFYQHPQQPLPLHILTVFEEFSRKNYGMGRNGMDFSEIIWDGME